MKVDAAALAIRHGLPPDAPEGRIREAMYAAEERDRLAAEEAQERFGVDLSASMVPLFLTAAAQPQRHPTTGQYVPTQEPSRPDPYGSAWELDPQLDPAMRRVRGVEWFTGTRRRDVLQGVTVHGA